MTKVEDSVSLLMPQKNVWLRLTEFDHWNEWLQLRDPWDKALGESMRFLGGEGTEMRFGRYNGETLMQTMRVTEWDPPRRLTMTIEGWNWKGGVNPKLKRLPEKRAKAAGERGSLKLAYGAELIPVTEQETNFIFRMEAEFTHPFLGFFLNLAYPIRRHLTGMAGDFTARFTKSLERHRAA